MSRLAPGSNIPIDATVVLLVSVVCCQCGRRLAQTPELDGESLKTGNTTQRADYHLDVAVRQVAGQAARELWVMVVMAEGPAKPLCGVCHAKSRVETVVASSATDLPRPQPCERIRCGGCGRWKLLHQPCADCRSNLGVP